MARRPEEASGSGEGAPAGLDEPRLAALRKQLRHPYITGQGLEPPQDTEESKAEQDRSRPATSEDSPAGLSDTTNP